MMDDQAVFLNVPFDARYELLFETLIASLVSLGLTPHSALEIRETGAGRLQRIQGLLESCRVSIHDLSRTGPPVRFNMPFELGLAVNLARYVPGHEIVVLEGKAHEVTRVLSDYRGPDPLTHNGRCDDLITCILDQFVTAGGITPVDGVQRVARLLRRTAREIKQQRNIGDVFHRSVFLDLVAAATDLAVVEGLIEP